MEWGVEVGAEAERDGEGEGEAGWGWLQGVEGGGAGGELLGEAKQEERGVGK